MESVSLRLYSDAYFCGTGKRPNINVETKIPLELDLHHCTVGSVHTAQVTIRSIEISPSAEADSPSRPQYIVYAKQYILTPLWMI